MLRCRPNELAHHKNAALNLATEMEARVVQLKDAKLKDVKLELGNFIIFLA